MKLSCLQENLSQGLSIVGRAVPSRTAMPILSNILLATDGGRLKLASTNLELSIVHWVGAMIEEEGAITVPARDLSDWVNSLPPERVTMTLDEETLTLHLVSGGVTAAFRGLAADEFPAIPDVEDHSGLSVEAGELREALEQVIFAASSDESHPVLTGVQAEFESDSLTLAAADGFRLAVRHLPLITPLSEPFSVIIPARALAELMRILGGREEPVEVATTPMHHQILFRLPDTVLNTQLIEGNFPDYRRIIPQSHTTKVTVGRAELLMACKRAAIVARTVSNIVRLEITAEGMTVSATSSEIGEVNTPLEAEVEGEPLTIAFNVRFLMDVLGALETPQVSLAMTTPTAPGVIRAVGMEESFVYVVMPMHLGR